MNSPDDVTERNAASLAELQAHFDGIEAQSVDARTDEEPIQIKGYSATRREQREQRRQEAAQRAALKRQAQAENWCCVDQHLHVAGMTFSIQGRGTPDDPDAFGATSVCCNCRRSTVVYTILRHGVYFPEGCGPGVRIEYAQELRPAPQPKPKITPSGQAEVTTPNGLIVPVPTLLVPGR